MLKQFAQMFTVVENVQMSEVFYMAGAKQLYRAPIENLNEISLRLLFMCMCEVPPKCMRKHNVHN